MADLIVVWARSIEDGQVNAFVVERGTPGYSARVIEGKVSLRSVWQADITLEDVRVPAGNRLPGARSFSDTSRVLATTRSTCAWVALGHATSAYDTAWRRRASPGLRHSPVGRPGTGPAGVGYAVDTPLTILLQEAGDIRAPMTDFTIDEEIVTRPDDGDIVVDADNRVVEALLQAFRSSRKPPGKVTQLRVGYPVVAGEGRGSLGHEQFTHALPVTIRYRIEEPLQRCKDRLFLFAHGSRLAPGAAMVSAEHDARAEDARAGARPYMLS